MTREHAVVSWSWGGTITRIGDTYAAEANAGTCSSSAFLFLYPVEFVVAWGIVEHPYGIVGGGRWSEVESGYERPAAAVVVPWTNSHTEILHLDTHVDDHADISETVWGLRVLVPLLNARI